MISCQRVVYFGLILTLSGILPALRAERAWGAGLTVNAQGVVVRDGLPYRAIGVNYFDSFHRTLGNPNDTSYVNGFKVLAAHNIVYGRVLLGGFWPNEIRLYVQDKAAYFQRMDAYVRAAEDNHFGIIADLFWCNWAVCDVVGEHMDAWSDLNSQTYAFMRQYVQDVVGRYKDSPAIWGWECGNEYNLSADLPYDHSQPYPAGWLPPIIPELGTATTRDPARDFFTSDMTVKMLTEFTTEVRKIDPDRIIVSGNSAPRGSAWHESYQNSWQTDTRAQFKTVLLRDNPDPLDMLCVHTYANTASGEGYFADQQVNNSGLLAEIMADGASVNKPVFLGEFGTAANLHPDPNNPSYSVPNPNEQAEVADLIAAIEDHKIPLSGIWNFDRNMDDPDYNITATYRGYLLDMVKAANDRIHLQLIAEGGYVPVKLSSFECQ
jgi:hypothetical protein